MARLVQTGFELNSTSTSMGDFNSSSGTFSINSDASFVRSGNYSLRTNPTNSTGRISFIFSSQFNQNLFFRNYLYIASLPNQDTKIIELALSSSSRGYVKMTSGGALQLFSEGDVQIGSDSSALSTGVWYRIEIKTDQKTSVGTCSIEGLIDGSSFASGSFGTAQSCDNYKIGAFTASTTADLYWDDIALNNDSGTKQNSYPGSGKIIHIKPNTTGDSNGFLVQVGGTAGSTNNYTRVNEVTPDDATSYNASVVLNAEDLMNCDDSGINSSSVVNVVAVGGRFANIIADATTAFKFEVEKTTGGTKSLSAAIIPNSTSWRTNQKSSATNVLLYPIILYLDPDGVSAWTQATLDSMQVGYILSTANVQTIAISTVWASVDYTPPAITTAVKQQCNKYWSYPI